MIYIVPVAIPEPGQGVGRFVLACPVCEDASLRLTIQLLDICYSGDWDWKHYLVKDGHTVAECESCGRSWHDVEIGWEPAKHLVLRDGDDSRVRVFDTFQEALQAYRADKAAGTLPRHPEAT